jgi:hypothetical protein
MLGFKTITTAAAVAGSLLLAACGGGGQTGGSTPTGVGGSGATVTPTAPASTSSTPTASDSTSSTPTASDNTSSTPPASDQSAAAPDVCTVLTAAQVAAILGVASVTSGGSPSTIASISTCSYSPPADGPHPYPVTVSLDVKDGSASTFGSIQQTLAPTTAIPGVGDAAFSYAAGIYALSGTNVIQITGPAGAILSNDFSADIAIAKDLIAALP